jgi:serine/threonine protein phosphatase PrpC
MLMTALKSAARTDPGRVRRNNEDSFHLDPDRGIFLVVDGIGGHNAGEKAAEIAVERIRARLERQVGAPEVRIREAIAIANNEILAAAKTNPEWEGMACVLTLALIENGSAYIGHVGDSRLYLIRRGEIRKITRDHSPVGEREDSGEIGETEAMRHPRRNEVFRDVGSEEHTPDDPSFIDIERLPFDAESALLLCSDGLSDQVPAAEIQAAVEQNAGDPDSAARALITAANAAGGKDNVTVMIVEGERFTAPAHSIDPVPRIRKWPFIVTAVIELAAAAALVYLFLNPKPPVIVHVAPATLIVGAGARYASINDALKDAKPGDTVEVLAGEYREQVALKAGVTLRSRITREARLIASPGNKAAVTANAIENARLEGFLIAADGQNPLEIGIVAQDSSVTIENNEIEGASTGIAISGPRAPELTANSIHDCVVAGVSVDSAKPWLFHNTFQHDKTALSLQGESHPQLIGNVFDQSPLKLPADLPLSTVRQHNFVIASPAARPATGSRGGREGR